MDINPYHSPLPPPRPPQSRQPSSSPESRSPIPSAPPDLPPLPEEQKPKKSKKKLLLIILAIVLLLGGGIAFYLWYTNPERVVRNAVENIIKSPSSIAEMEYKGVTPNGEEVTIQLKTKSDNPNLVGQLDAKVKLNLEDFELEIDGAWMATKDGNVYVKINNMKELYLKSVKTEYGEQYLKNAELRKAIIAFIKKVDGQWVKLDWQELAQGVTNGQAKERKCYQKVATAFYEDKGQQQQIINMYSDNKFILVRSDSILSSFNDTEYDVSFDLSKAYDFTEKTNSSDVAKAFKKCNSGNNSYESAKPERSELSEAQKEMNKVDIKLWISRWTHDLTDASIRYEAEEGEHTFKIKTDFKNKPSIKTPSQSLSIEELQKELEAIAAYALVQTAESTDAQ